MFVVRGGFVFSAHGPPDFLLGGKVSTHIPGGSIDAMFASVTATRSPVVVRLAPGTETPLQVWLQYTPPGLVSSWRQ